MTIAAPVTDLDRRFSSPGAKALPWKEAVRQLREAEVLWLSTVTPEGRPHVAPLIAIWLDGALYFSTGEEERKARNLRANRHVTIATGTNDLTDGLDIVVEGEAAVVSGAAGCAASRRRTSRSTGKVAPARPRRRAHLRGDPGQGVRVRPEGRSHRPSDGGGRALQPDPLSLPGQTDGAQRVDDGRGLDGREEAGVFLAGPAEPRPRWSRRTSRPRANPQRLSPLVEFG
jgi:nitroimidazol reductase NimA-like FMN-containing flavoprotein (pyridoxamine 5'-phosphate oxidase superfamily)